MKGNLVRHYLADRLCDALFHQPGPSRLRALLEALPGQLQIALSEAVEIAEEDPRLVQVGTRWDLSHRGSVRERPLGGALQHLLNDYGRPMPRALLVANLCLGRPVDPVEAADLLDRLLRGGREVGALDDGSIYLKQWLPYVAEAEDSSLIFLNDLQEDEEYLGLRTKAMGSSIKGRTLAQTAEAALKAVKVPLNGKGLGLILYHHHQDRFDPADYLNAVCNDETFLVLSGPTFGLQAVEKSILRDLGKLDRLAEEPRVDIEATLDNASGPEFRLDAESLQVVLATVKASRSPVPVSELLADVLQLRPRQRNYGPAALALDELLTADMTLQQLRRGVFEARSSSPQWVRELPAALIPQALGPMPGQPVSGATPVLPPSALAEGLAERVEDPFYEDQGETEIGIGEERANEATAPVLYHHYLCGTLKLRLVDRRLFHTAAPIGIVAFRPPEGPEFPVWINSQVRLLYGFLPWYHANLPPCGGLVTIRALEGEQEVFEISHEGATDSGTYIGRERFASLLPLRDKLRAKRATLPEIVGELLEQAEHGLLFDQLWAQVNVIRRTTRLQLASALMLEQRFAPAEGNRWRVEAGG